jgi:hypothetical protein
MTRISLPEPPARPVRRLDDPDDDFDDDLDEDQDEDDEEEDEEEPWGDEDEGGPEWQVTDGLTPVDGLTCGREPPTLSAT